MATKVDKEKLKKSVVKVKNTAKDYGARGVNHSADVVGRHPKAFLGVLGILVVGGIGTVIYRNYKANKALNDAKKAADKTAGTINTVNLTITESKALLIANQIEANLDGWISYEDATAKLLLDVTLTNDDLKLIYKKFGIRTYHGGGIFEKNVDLDLTGWIDYEFNSGKQKTNVLNRLKAAGL